ncbi:plasma alpha-L-fucosidase-like [Diachasmimorpha longicaudata]|uniref:plasma alpha-L-fucosidase-like n=1 Tax=Diachasmimorpha longicaudata TaxID=58733 RepID=UPI0030B9113A
MLIRIVLTFMSILAVRSEPQHDVYVVESDLKVSSENSGGFLPTWESLDTRALPKWYDNAKIGIFIHWGVYSVPSFHSEWFWNHWKTEKVTRELRDFMKKNYKPDFSYQDFARDFTAEFYDPNEWARLFEASGAKYVVLTSKHHEGYTLWPSKYSFSWNAMDVGPHRDLVGELADAVRANTTLRFGLYHSFFEWYNPLYLEDKSNNFTSDKFMQSKVIPEMHEIVEKYKPEVFWSDGDGGTSEEYWKSKEFIAYLYNDSPVRDTVVVNDRWGTGTNCKHGDFYSCADRFNPGHLLPHKWENAMTIDKKSWGYRRNAALEDYMTTEELVQQLVSTISCGGNLLINVGPTKDGIIAPIFQDRLLGLGHWLKVNGEAIYNTSPWRAQNDTITGDTWYTANVDSKTLYAIVLTWPEDDILELGALPLGQPLSFEILGHSGKIEWREVGDRILVNLPGIAHRGQPAWTLKIR